MQAGQCGEREPLMTSGSNHLFWQRPRHHQGNRRASAVQQKRAFSENGERKGQEAVANSETTSEP